MFEQIHAVLRPRLRREGEWCAITSIFHTFLKNKALQWKRYIVEIISVKFCTIMINCFFSYSPWKHHGGGQTNFSQVCTATPLHASYTFGKVDFSFFHFQFYRVKEKKNTAGQHQTLFGILVPFCPWKFFWLPCFKPRANSPCKLP